MIPAWRGGQISLTGVVVQTAQSQAGSPPQTGQGEVTTSLRLLLLHEEGGGGGGGGGYGLLLLLHLLLHRVLLVAFLSPPPPGLLIQLPVRTLLLSHIWNILH